MTKWSFCQKGSTSWLKTRAGIFTDCFTNNQRKMSLSLCRWWRKLKASRSYPNHPNSIRCTNSRKWTFQSKVVQSPSGIEKCKSKNWQMKNWNKYDQRQSLSLLIIKEKIRWNFSRKFHKTSIMGKTLRWTRYSKTMRYSPITRLETWWFKINSRKK